MMRSKDRDREMAVVLCYKDDTDGADDAVEKVENAAEKIESERRWGVLTGLEQKSSALRLVDGGGSDKIDLS
jgi:hypothetical protein